MSGITGWVSYARDLTTQREVVDAMTATMADRGPDGGRTHLEPRVALGHRQLVVTSATTPTGQPTTARTPDGDVTIVADGEVYNASELRGELRSHGHPVGNTDDAEVVLRGYLEWGTAVVDHLNGMYAFAIWDARTETLLLARDRMGVKPLYYYPTPDGVLFGSEPKAILANPLADPVVDADGLREIYNRFFRAPGAAVWAGMREVKAGTVVTVDRSGAREQRYWQLRAVPHPDDLGMTIDTIRGLLNDTLIRQLIGDKPWCVMLSGGLDSSSLTALAAPILAERGERISTWSVDFVGQAENFRSQPELGRPTADLPFAHDLAAHVGTEHHDVVFDHRAVADPEVRRACVAARDIPIGLGDRDFSAYLLLKAIRERSPVALSGDGSDAVFASYSMRDKRTGATDRTPGLLSFPFQDHGLLSRSFLRAIGYEEHLQAKYDDAVAGAPQMPGEAEAERRMRLACYLDMMCMVPPALADRRDRYGMAVGVEVRVPYYDHRLVEYVFNAPTAMKTFDGREKSLLRAVTAPLLPTSVVNRGKSGYPSPHDPQYAALLQRQVADVVAADHPALEFYDRALVREAVAADPRALDNAQRCGMERLLDMAVWMDLRHPVIKVS
jgi:asparagine synthase (glutamine-hydrolysing)